MAVGFLLSESKALKVSIRETDTQQVLVTGGLGGGDQEQPGLQ